MFNAVKKQLNIESDHDQSKDFLYGKLLSNSNRERAWGDKIRSCQPPGLNLKKKLTLAFYYCNFVIGFENLE
jgi:hypothetical protein